MCIRAMTCWAALSALSAIAWSSGRRLASLPTQPNIELYDYQSDPDETKNLAEDQPEVVAQLRTILRHASRSQASVSCRRSATPQKAKKPSPSRTAWPCSRSRDKDQDGKLTREEVLANQPDPDEAPKRFPKFDDGPGRLLEPGGVCDQWQGEVSGLRSPFPQRPLRKRAIALDARGTPDGRPGVERGTSGITPVGCQSLPTPAGVEESNL